MISINKKLRLKNNRIITFENMEMMGIVNVTPDSFYDRSRNEDHAKAIEQARRHISEGAKMIDVGGESTRPGSAPVDEETEIGRICPVIERIREEYPDIVISADTYRASTASAALEAGADMINDISGFTFEPEIAEVIGNAGAAAVIMHTPDRPRTMQDDPVYDNVVEEVYSFLKRQIDHGTDRGIGRDQIMIDMGIGFGKTPEHNLCLLRNIDRFRELGCPHLLAVSRKSFIGAVMATAGAAEGAEDMPPGPEGRLAGTLAVTAYAAAKGIEAARVHDVAENLQAARIAEAVSMP